jgi:flagellar biosynthesis/type III secretory pathway chaperone
MNEFAQLLHTLERELEQQEKLLDILMRERAAIAKLHHDKVTELAVEKERILERARSIETNRNGVLETILGPVKAMKFSEVLEKCKDLKLRLGLESIGSNLKQTAQIVRELNDENGKLVKQAMGLIASTMAIFRGSGGAELPTYSNKGAIKSEESQVYVRRSLVSREV